MLHSINEAVGLLNQNTMFAGIMLLLLNVGSRYIVHEFSSDDKEAPTHNITVQYNTSGGLNATTSSFELTSVYYYESLILLAISIFIASLFIIVLVIIFAWLICTRYGLRHVNPNDHLP